MRCLRVGQPAQPRPRQLATASTPSGISDTGLRPRLFELWPRPPEHAGAALQSRPRLSFCPSTYRGMHRGGTAAWLAARLARSCALQCWAAAVLRCWLPTTPRVSDRAGRVCRADSPSRCDHLHHPGRMAAGMRGGGGHGEPWKRRHLRGRRGAVAAAPNVQAGHKDALQVILAASTSLLVSLTCSVACGGCAARAELSTGSLKRHTQSHLSTCVCFKESCAPILTCPS